MARNSRSGLGRGLDALIPPAAGATGLKRVSIDAIVPNPLQPRTHFDSEALAELADSIREMGLIQPLIVQLLPSADAEATPQRYQLIAGERRWRAAQIAGLRHLDVIVKDVTPQETLELALVENIQRADLNPLEEAQAYQALSKDFGMTQDQIAERVGRSRVSITNALRLLRLPPAVKAALAEGKISEGHARALLMLEDEADQIRTMTTVIRRGFSVRQTEELVRRLHKAADKSEDADLRLRSPEVDALESRFRESLGTKVELFKTRKGGRLVIHFYSDDDLQSLYDRLIEE